MDADTDGAADWGRTRAPAALTLPAIACDAVCDILPWSLAALPAADTDGAADCGRTSATAAWAVPITACDAVCEIAPCDLVRGEAGW